MRIRWSFDGGVGDDNAVGAGRLGCLRYVNELLIGHVGRHLHKYGFSLALLLGRHTSVHLIASSEDAQQAIVALEFTQIWCVWRRHVDDKHVAVNPQSLEGRGVIVGCILKRRDF